MDIDIGTIALTDELNGFCRAAVLYSLHLPLMKVILHRDNTRDFFRAVCDHGNGSAPALAVLIELTTGAQLTSVIN